jgi:predicted Zn finger-like uncharacterized protein
MDVRCEKCGTEYELDDAKVTEAGVTVKCTSCGNLFKVRRRASSQMGAMPRPTTPPVAGAAGPGDGASVADDKAWMIRNPTGQVQRFRELTTLQQWIVERKVTREFEISRTGEHWRRLGEIAELASFFLVVDQADAAARAAAEREGVRRSTQPFAPAARAPSARPARKTTPNMGGAPVIGPAKTPPPEVAAPAPPPSPSPGPPGLTTLRGHETLETPRPGPLPTPRRTPTIPPASGGTRPRSGTSPPPIPGIAAMRPQAGTAPPPMPANNPARERPRSGTSPPPIPGIAAPRPQSQRPSIPPPATPEAFDGAGGEPSGPIGGLRGAPVAEPSWAANQEAVRRTRAQMEAKDTDAQGPMSAGPMQNGPMAAGPAQGLMSAGPAAPAAPHAHLPDDLGGRPMPVLGPGRDDAEPAPFEPSDADLDDDFTPPPSRLKWVALGLVLMLGGGAGVYFLLKPKADEMARAERAALAAPDAMAPTGPVVSPVGGADAAPSAGPEAALSAGWAAFYQDGDEAFDGAELVLGEARVPDPTADAEVLAALALVSSARAQALVDDAELVAAADARRAEQLRAEAGRRLERAEKYAKDAAAKAPTAKTVLVALADVRRLQKAKPAEIDKLLGGAQGHVEANYVRGMSRLGAGQLADARRALEVCVSDYRAQRAGEHLRARYHLAWIAWSEKRFDDARRELEAILAAKPDHVRAKALLDRVDADAGTTGPGPSVWAADAGAVAAGPPGGPGSSGPGSTGPGPGPGPGGQKPPPGDPGVPSGPVGVDAYDGLVAKGNQRAENGDCTTAMKFFEKALDARPSGVEALTGLGYCHMDRKEFPRAQASFRAALGISPRFGDAIIGLAEAYRYQSQNEKAVEYYQRYLEALPGGSKAEMARRQIKALSPPEPEPEAPKPAPNEGAPDKPTEPLKDKPQDPPPEGVTVPESP